MPTSIASTTKNKTSETHPHAIGTLIYKNFPSYGWFWGTVNSVYFERNVVYYDILYSDGDSETLDHTEIEEWVKHANDKTKINRKFSGPSEGSDESSANDSIKEQRSESDFTDDDENLVDTEDESDFSSRENVRSSSRKRNLLPKCSTPRKRYRLEEKDNHANRPIGSSVPITQRRTSPMRTCKLPQTNVAGEDLQKAALVSTDLKGKKGTICHYFQSCRKTNDICMNDTESKEEVSVDVMKTSYASGKSVPGLVDSVFPGTKPSKKRAPAKSKSVPPASRVLKKTMSNASSQENAGVGTYDKQPYVGGKDLEVISDIQQMFDDMISTKIFRDTDRSQMLLSFLQKLQRRPLRVATMCSGTESPILALDMIQNAIGDAISQSDSKCWRDLLQSKADGAWFPVEHVFSCEIEPFKQAYIERNFHPPLLFRDIRELGDAQAYTAYGAYVDVPNTPGCVDVLIAGTSCVDYSNLNNQKKNMEEKGESGATFYGMIRWIEKAQPSIVIIENVYGAPWNEKVAIFEKRGYSTTFIRLDTKDYYIPHTRQRGYLFAVRKIPQRKSDSRPSDWSEMVKAFKRPASASVDDFMLPNDDPRVVRGRNRLTAESLSSSGDSRAGRVDWTKCETRHLAARSLEELGEKRPFTGWSDSGSTTLPSFCWNEWCNVQVHRIHDVMDINTLRLAKVGIDGTYKTMVWNLSQNVDRDTMGKLGLCQCLTPTGVPYVSNRGGPLVGEELLMLQGIPVDDLLLTKETEENLKDLAGNAMSTTVVGACTLCALLVGHDSLPSHYETTSQCKVLPSLVPRPIEPLSEIAISRTFGEYEHVTLNTSCLVWSKSPPLDSFLLEASISAKLCVSEGPDEVTPFELLAQCRICGYTSCSKNACPPRKYEEHEFEPFKVSQSRVDPVSFRRTLLNLLPMQCNVVGIEPNDFHPPDTFDLTLWRQWVEAVRSSLALTNNSSTSFRLVDVKRTHIWIAHYESQSKARLEVKISKTGITWYLFARSPCKEGPLKNLLDRPFARMKVSSLNDGSFSMIHGQWDVCLPVTMNYKVCVRGEGKLLPSWQNRLGLKGEFENAYQFETLRINVQSQDLVALSTLKNTIDGDYVLLSKCGGACGSLRRKCGSAGEGDLFFFLSSGRATLSRDDVFVVASSFHRTAHDEYREFFLETETGFSPTISRTADEVVDYAVEVNCSTFGSWIAQENMAMKELSSCDMFLTRPLSRLDVSIHDFGWKLCPELISSKVIVNANDDLVSYCMKLGGSVEVNLQKSKKIFRDIAFIISRWSLPSLFTEEKWLQLLHPNASMELSRCSKCAPLKPEIKWTLVAKGKKASFVPLEDGKEAAVYERALKNRPKPWLLRIAVVDGDSELERATTMAIQVGCNAVSLVQRAYGLLPAKSFARLLLKETLGNELSSCLFDWRVLLHTDNGVAFPNLTFTSNKRDDEASQPPRFLKYKLRKEQLRSLTWMLKQESNLEPFFEEEVAEAILPGLNWRVEGRVRRPVLVRGGIIADEVGYGKTAITLGLIDSAESVNGTTAEPPEEYRSRYIYTKATLVVVPKHLMGQWPNEVEKFLGTSKKVCVIKDLSSLNNLTINDIQRADIVIVSFAVLNNENYFSRLARLSGVNPDCFPKGSGGSRHFASVYSQCLHALPAQVETIVHNCAEAYAKITQAAKAHGTLNNSVLLDGKKSAYKNGKKVMVATHSNGKVANADKDPWGLSNAAVKKNYLKMSCPPLEMFFWQRLVVDEFTYLSKKDRERVLEVISSIHTFFRWCLSGTPKHANFNDISCLSSLLDVYLGADEVLPGVKLNKRYLAENENSGLESLSHYLESRSLQWHFRRHLLAQQFLDRFVRQNVAEIDEIPYEEHICVVNLPPVERAIYMELETHLKSLEMNSNTAQKSKRKSTGDRESRMQRILQDSESGEEALLKCSSHFNMSASFTAIETIDDIIKLRESEKSSLEIEMTRSLAAAFRQQKKILFFQPDWSSVTITGKGEVQDALRVFLNEVQAKNSVPHGADNEINDRVSLLVLKGQEHFEARPNEFDSFFMSSGDSDDEMAHEAKAKKSKRPPRAIDETALFEMKHALRNHMHFVRSLAKELCGRIRSLRYIEHIRRLQLNEKENESKFVCGMCKQDVHGLKCTIGVLSCCGHAGCVDCLRKRAFDGLCIFPDCCARVSSAHIASADRLGLESEDSCSGRFGRKLTAVVSKVTEILKSEKDNRLIVFCQFDDLKSKIAEALSCCNIKSLEVKGTVGQQINTLSIFQRDTPEAADPRVLLLKMDDEQSAGLNLTNLNHALFVHPLLASTQEEYIAYETQAIGRIRRFGQKKKVHCWRFLAQDTIDTEIYAQRSQTTLS